MVRFENTIAKEVSFAGVGIHTGAQGKVTLHPAPAGTGRVFRVGGQAIPALVSYVSSTQRSTVLANGQAQVSTVEHLLAALYGLNVDNVEMEIEGPEIPILDGSALPIVSLLQKAGIVEQEREIWALELKEPSFVAHERGLVLAMPDSINSFEAAVSYACPEVGIQRYRYNSYDSFPDNVAPARTFGFWEEVKPLLQQGLALGADLSNALIFGRPKDSGIADRLAKSLAQSTAKGDGNEAQRALEAANSIASKANGPALRFVNEPVRHKVLDLMGDLALLGRPLSAFVLACRAGHRLHTDFVRELTKEYALELSKQ